MDDAVLAALAKWPDVPACYGWISLDARGRWRLGAPDSPRREIVRHAGLSNFLGRNYACNENGEWFCQNGPQRAYVNIECAPWVIRLTPAGHLPIRLTTHTGLEANEVRAAHLDRDGRIYLATELGLGVIDDRDLTVLIGRLVRYDTNTLCTDDMIATFCAGGEGNVALDWCGTLHLLGRLTAADLETRYGFVKNPAFDDTSTTPPP